MPPLREDDLLPIIPREAGACNPKNRVLAGKLPAEGFAGGGTAKNFPGLCYLLRFKTDKNNTE